MIPNAFLRTFSTYQWKVFRANGVVKSNVTNRRTLRSVKKQKIYATTVSKENEEEKEVSVTQVAMKLREKLIALGWTDRKRLRLSVPNLSKEANDEIASRRGEGLVSYYRKQLYIWEKKKQQKFTKHIKSLSRRKKIQREDKRLQDRFHAIKDTTRLYKKNGSEMQSLNKSLNTFRFLIHEKLPDSAMPQNKGWPPHNAIFLGTIPPYNRQLYMFNQRLQDGRHRDPVLAICIRDNPVLILREAEVLKLEELIPKLIADGKKLKKHKNNI